MRFGRQTQIRGAVSRRLLASFGGFSAIYCAHSMTSLMASGG